MSVSTKSWVRPLLEPLPGNMPSWKREVLERKRAKLAAASIVPGDSSPGGKDEGERLVLQDSLGPLHENPFIKLEQERRRRRPVQHPTGRPGSASTPIKHLLDLYSNVPGIRTIRAENIIIIESDPRYFGGRSDGTGLQTHGDPVDELLAKRGSKVTEIRASEVVIYEPDPSHALEKTHNDVLEEAGRVSRLLEKFDHGHSRPLRTRSWENLLEKDIQPKVNQQSKLPKPTVAERPSQVKEYKRPGSVSASSASLLDEDSKRFPLNNPSWLPSKPPAVHSLPDPGLFHKRPSSPLSSPQSGTPVSPSFPLGSIPSRYETSTDEKIVSPVVATFRERFEVGSSQNNLPQSKLKGIAQKTGNTMVINPKAANPKVRSSEPVFAPYKDGSRLTNGYVGHSIVDTPANSKILDMLSKTKRDRGTFPQRMSEGSGQVPSTASVSSNEISKGNSTRRPNSEVDHGKSKIPPKPSATQSEAASHNLCDQGLTSATPNQKNRVSFSTSSNDSFEIKPAPKPNLQIIPEEDIQAKALANIRLQSKNSFVFVPKKRQAPSVPKQNNPVQRTHNDKPKVKESASICNGHQEERVDSPPENGFQATEDASQSCQRDTSNGMESVDKVDTQKASTVPALLDFDWKSGLLPPQSSTESHSFTDIGAELEYFSSIHQEDDELSVPVTKIHEEDPVKHEIPITNIDDLVNSGDRDINQGAKPGLKGTDSSVPSYRPHASLSSVRSKGGNTFTVVPKRKPVTEQEAFRNPVVDQDEDDDDEAGSKQKSPNGTEPPYSHLGAKLKNRYPTVDEIQVIGGYLSLSKSCLSKNDSARKKMKISFNEQNIHTMFEYPSENSLADYFGEDETNEASGSESDEDEKPVLLFPRPTFVNSGGSGNGLRANAANSGLSSYTPKHSIEYRKWQEEKPFQDSQGTQEDMLTPADSSSPHIDFRSEPALYF